VLPALKWTYLAHVLTDFADFWLKMTALSRRVDSAYGLSKWGPEALRVPRKKLQPSPCDSIASPAILAFLQFCSINQHKLAYFPSNFRAVFSPPVGSGSFPSTL
jgi:hypothetical protein